jgi:hypothetical protein
MDVVILIFMHIFVARRFEGILSGTHHLRNMTRFTWLCMSFGSVDSQSDIEP